ncbi:hypothetical protein ACHAW5_000601 [Stephanodiscus triporus]|uniref:G-protein coupled receptors family 2 profile 2 domain-containing protein n=1 Tax=Stephanodiscus triporus TaxID=2934178 RepID=A0ABD3NQX8_9STRA
MSLCCLSSSVAWFFTTWPIPRGTPGVYGAVGTQGTCSAQGFFSQFKISSVMYNASLSVYFVLVIVKQWRDDRILKVEPFIHLHAMAWGLGTALASIFLTLFNDLTWNCWISASPMGCEESWKNDGVTTCVRGDNASLYRWAFYFGPVWVVITVVTILMYWVYYTVRRQERAMARLQSVPNGASDRDLLKKTAIQAAYYVGAFYVTWFFPTIFHLVLVTSGKVYFPLLFLTSFFVPIQGLLNLIVFVRPKYGRYVKNNPDQFFLLAWFRMILIELGCRKESSEARNSRASFRWWLGNHSARYSFTTGDTAPAAAASDAAEAEHDKDL